MELTYLLNSSSSGPSSSSQGQVSSQDHVVHEASETSGRSEAKTKVANVKVNFGTGRVAGVLLVISVTAAVVKYTWSLCRAGRRNVNTSDTDVSHPLHVIRTPHVSDDGSLDDIFFDAFDFHDILGYHGLGLPPLDDPSYDHWLKEFLVELEREGIPLTKGVDKADLRRFICATGGDHALLKHRLKQTIKWRQSYPFSSSQMIQRCSHVLFWHGLDKQFQPCLIIRIGLACNNLLYDHMPLFAQAIVSLVDYGVREACRLTVVMDCEDLTSLRFPLLLMKSSFTLLEEHCPEVLQNLLIVRLSPSMKIMAESFLQDAKSVTRERVKILGEDYQLSLSQLISVPAFLGGDCTCHHCKMLQEWEEADQRVCKEKWSYYVEDMIRYQKRDLLTWWVILTLCVILLLFV